MDATLSAKVYRRFEQQGIVPAQRGVFLDELAEVSRTCVT